MKYNQYAYIPTSAKTQIKELKQIHFLSQNDQTKSFADLLETLVENVLAQAKTPSAKQAKLAAFAVNDQQTLADFLKTSPTEISQKAFSNVALQLLGYHVPDDYDLKAPHLLIKKNGLPLGHEAIKDNAGLIAGFYRLLNTRAKNGQLLIDTLAANGYFTPFYGTRHFMFFNGKSLPIFDTQKIIREVVYVASDLDSDQDGQNDLLQVSIMRPIESSPDFKVPALYTADPYFGGIIDNVKKNHSVDENLTDATQQIEAAQVESPRIKADQPIQGDHASTEIATRKAPYSLNEYMLARGFANVYAGGIGTRGSDGIRICGAPEETICAKEVIEWLHGDRVAYTDRNRSHEIKASWCNGKIGMTGRSYLGTLQIAVATTGVKGLKTVVSEAAISSWYDYYREHGLVVAPIACQGEDTDLLSETCQSNLWDAGDYLKVKDIYAKTQKGLLQNEDRLSGQYSKFWDRRNYRHHTNQIKCSFICVHGLNDWNVKPKNVYKLWQKLDQLPIVHKLFLHQGPHYNMNNLVSIDFSDLMNLWFCHELLACDNGGDQQWPNVMIQDNLKADCWHQETTWNDQLATTVAYYPGNENQLTPESEQGELSFTDVGGKDFKAAKISEQTWQDQMIRNDSKWAQAQLYFESDVFIHPITIIGRPRLQIRVKASLNKGQLSACLVEVGTRKRLTPIPKTLIAGGQELGFRFGTESLKEFVFDKATPAKLITKAHMNLQNYADMKHPASLNANQFYDLAFDLQPTYYQLPAGSKLALIVYATDQGMTKRPLESETYTIDLSQTVIHFSRR